MKKKRPPRVLLDVVMHFPQIVIVRSSALLPMLYTPRELGEELGVLPGTIRDWIHLGMPHTRDAKNRIWINGVEFAKWVERVRNEQREHRLKPDEAYCLRCKKPVRLSAPNETRAGNLIVLHDKCPVCGTPIHRGERAGQSR